ncbi:MAG TPA: stress response translation initiation inhibitor YciH [Chloroflexota bacterium]|nr:stress response translation initiation inhibitor YciH [Chloroflexota bacterium]HEX2986948.1 stress response translation initiation inhibitor YciH [Chloroflexota bacterium]
MPLQPGRPGNDRPVVYDSDVGRVCPTCGQPEKSCRCRRKPAVGQAKQPQQSLSKPDGILRVSRDRSHRRGKTVTVITGAPGGPAAIDDLAGTLKRLCGSGGTVKDGVIEIQGDHREQVLSKLLEMGFKAKQAGG